MCAARFDDGDLHGVLPMTAVNTNGKDNILHVACSLGKLDRVKHIISQNIVSINSKGEYGRTPVMCAAAKGHVALFKLLVKEGADLSIVDDYSNTILHHTCAEEHLGMVKHIISQNIVSIDRKGQSGRTPVVFAAENGYVALFKLFAKEGADLSIVDDDGNNILHIACVGGNVDIVKHIISQNIVSIDSKGQDGVTPVICAVQEDHMAVFKLLVREGADLSIVDDNGTNILHVACAGARLDMVKYIISRKMVSIDSKGMYGRTPVMYAAERGHVDVIKLLVTEGADLSIVDYVGNNILHLTCARGHLDIVKYIISRKMVSIDSKGQYDKTPVMYAAGHVDIIELLVTEGADVCGGCSW